MAVKPIPDGYHTVTPYLISTDASGLLDYMQKAFGSKDRGDRFTGPDGKIVHAEVTLGDSVIMVADANEEHPAAGGRINLYVEDCDATYATAMAAGATSKREPEDQFYGDRSAGIEDPYGNVWWINTHVEDVEPDEMARRAQEFAAQQQGG
jgi:PhnB protein